MSLSPIASNPSYGVTWWVAGHYIDLSDFGCAPRSVELRPPAPSDRFITIAIYYTNLRSDLGELLLASDGTGLQGIWFCGQKYAGTPGTDWQCQPDLSLLRAACRQLDEYFGGSRQAFDVPLALPGTDFQRAVWHELLGIPWGETISYSELARRLGKPSAVRATAAAVGRNPVSIMVPCHRVIGANGSLTGYAGGLARKRVLLDLERR